MKSLQTILNSNPAELTDIEALIRLAHKNGFVNTAERAAAEYRRLKGVNGSLRIALQFYSNIRNWSFRDGIIPTSSDLGAKARHVLELLKGN